jgi:3-oxoacyl-(acyl-carrier-protein) synthase
MRVSRRGFVKAGAAGAAVLGSHGAALAAGAPALLVYDSRLASSIAFAAASPCLAIDVAREHGRRWQALRGALPPGRIAGLTRWQDYVLVRGMAEDQRRRLVSERRVGNLIAFELA